jgi:EpsI family protein
LAQEGPGVTTVRRRAVVIAAALTGTAVLSALVRPRADTGGLPASTFGRLFPTAFGSWRVDQRSAAFVRTVDPQGRLANVYDRLIERNFVDDDGYHVMLSVAYNAHAFDGSSALQVHRPEVCYRSAGYQIGDPTEAALNLTDRTVAVTRVLARLQGRAEPITYWILVGGRAISEHGQMRKRRILAALRRQPLDSMLVRVSSIDRDTAFAYRKQAAFADELATVLAPPDRAFGVRLACVAEIKSPKPHCLRGNANLSIDGS